YQEMLPLAKVFLENRGVTMETAEKFRLGVVDSPEPGHEPYVGRLVVPYLDMLGVYALKFRCLAGHDCKAEDCSKFPNLPGQALSIYNVTAVDSTSDTLHIAEGEPDTWILTQVFPDGPVIGWPGAQ